MSGAARLVAVLFLPALVICSGPQSLAQPCIPFADQPLWLGETGIDACTAMATAPEDRLVVLRDATLEVWDVADPVAPRLWDELDLGVAQAGLAVSGETILLAGDAFGAIGVRVATIDPLLGLVATGVVLGPEPAVAVAAAGGLVGACLADGFSLWDATDPHAPIRHATVRDGLAPRWIAMAPDRLAVADSAGAVRVYDTGDPARPVLIGGWEPAATFLLGLTYVDGLVQELLVAATPRSDPLGGSWLHCEFRLRCVDAEAPGGPLPVATLDLGEFDTTAYEPARGMLAAAGDRVLVAARSRPVLVALAPREPEAALYLPVGRGDRLCAHAAARSGDVLFAAQEDEVTARVDAWQVPTGARGGQVAVPAATIWDRDGSIWRYTRLVGSASSDSLLAVLWHREAGHGGDTSWWPRVDVYALAAAPDGGATAAPMFSVDLGWRVWSYDVAIVGATIYVALDTGLVGIEASPGGSRLPFDLLWVPAARSLETLAADLLAVGRNDGRLTFCRVDSPELVWPVGTWDLGVSGAAITDLMRDGDLLLATAVRSGLQHVTVDIADPAHPQLAHRLVLDGYWARERMSALGPGRTLLAAAGPRLAVVDHTVQPPRVEVETALTPPWFVTTVQALDGRIYALGNGIHELRADDLSFVGGIAATSSILAATAWRGNLLVTGQASSDAIALECAPAAVRGGDDGAWIPVRLAAWPNPANPSVAIRFILPESRHVDLAVHDLRGRRLRTVADGHRRAGPHEVVWDGRDAAGGRVASGTYLLRLVSGPATGVTKVTLLR